ncbi:hypothetical protein IEQ34_017378 [Dendrobium chrysotoxum]|uniref:Uncharacterized protein n=1 Tax=Dendrobium chrysotoxum TaxID=161865 RepID=A0AAV7GB28_DENCH|nr:hypothetical protein IEQ34_017378 [Dendrobium chrysotoxum]
MRAGLRFPPPAELIEISKKCEVILSKFSHRAMSVMVGLITLAFFLVRNDWGLLEKWGKMRDLSAPLHIGEEDIMRLLKVPDVEHILYEVRYLNKYIEEEFLFKVGQSIHLGRSYAQMLKPTFKGVTKSTSKVPLVSSPVKFHVPGDVLSHQCVERRKASDLLSRRTELEAELIEALNEWNVKFVKVKYLQGEYKQKYDHKTREAKNQQIDHLQVDLERAQSLRVIEDFKKSIAFKIIIQDHVQEAHDHIYEGFIRGFLKGVRLVQQKTGVEVEGLIPNQASDDFPPNLMEMI